MVWIRAPHIKFQSTLPVWGATGGAIPGAGKQAVSIHAPRVGSDRLVVSENDKELSFNPRSPCGERLLCAAAGGLEKSFQSTLPVWGATFENSEDYKATKFQSTLPVWGATPKSETINTQNLFQSTLPVWGATLIFG